MKGKFFIVVVFFNVILFPCFSNDSAKEKQSIIYNFPIYNGSINMMTMEQSDEIFSSTYQLTSRIYFDTLAPLNTSFWRQNAIFFPYFLFDFLILEPFTHEEAHRAILTNKGIGSISQPFMKPVKVYGLFLGGAAYVKGVNDDTLKHLRDTDLPSFIRLHTAGIESDYILAKKAFTTMALNIDYVSDYKAKAYFGPAKGKESDWYINNIEYISRTANTWFYLYGGLSPSKLELEEEDDELERDIVGDDVYGAIHHLFQPKAKYQRYIDYNELTEEERAFAKRVGWRSFLDLPIISPLWLGKNYFNIGQNHTLSFNTGYALAPFGDFIDENIYYSYLGFNSPLRFSFYARQYENRSHWFPAFGIQLVQYSPLNWLVINAESHFWIQPENLDFNTNKGEPGGAVKAEIIIIPEVKKHTNLIDNLGISIGLMYKTKGYLPEIESHNSLWRAKVGIVFKK